MLGRNNRNRYVVSPMRFFLAAATKNPRSWIAAVLDKLDRLSRVSDRLKDYRGVTIIEWIALIRADPPAFNKIIRKF